MKPKAPLSDEGFALMGAAFAVHKELGGGLLEEIYQESLELELVDQGIHFQARPGLAVYYKGRELKKRYIPDLITHNAIIVELKAVTKLAAEHEAQLLNYMRITGKQVGYLINFAPLDAVEWKRFII